MKKVDYIRYCNLHKLFKPFYAGLGHVLVFHRVGYDNTVFHNDLQVTPEYLDRTIQYFLQHNIDIITLDEMYSRIHSKARLRRFVVFTFDDGYTDNYTNALPVFEKYNVPLTLFLTTGYPDKKIFPWGLLLEELVTGNSCIEFTYHDQHCSFETITIQQKRDAFYKIRRYIRDSNLKDLDSRLRAVFRSDYPKLYETSERVFLSWDQLRVLGRHPLVAIQAHSVNHIALSSLEKADVESEINESVQRIEQETGNRPSYFAYPFGGHNEAAKREFDIAEKCNIRLAFTAVNGNVLRKDINHLTALPRIGLNEKWSPSHIDLYINGFTPFVNKFR